MKVYAMIDESGGIIAVNSDAYMSDLCGWTQIDEGNGISYRYAQSNYFAKPIRDGRGIKRYRACQFADIPDDRAPICIFERDGATWAVYERTQEEMDADYVEPEVQPSDKERIEALENQLAAYEAAFAEGVCEGWA